MNASHRYRAALRRRILGVFKRWPHALYSAEVVERLGAPRTLFASVRAQLDALESAGVLTSRMVPRSEHAGSTGRPRRYYQMTEGG